jgi:hypothetical protein
MTGRPVRFKPCRLTGFASAKLLPSLGDLIWCKKVTLVFNHVHGDEPPEGLVSSCSSPIGRVELDSHISARVGTLAADAGCELENHKPHHCLLAD